MKPIIIFLLCLVALTVKAQNIAQEVPSTPRSREAVQDNQAALQKALEAKGMNLGDPIFMRIFKESNELEVWVQPEHADKFSLFKTYKICYYSGDLGPKTKQGAVSYTHLTLPTNREV